MCKGLCDACEMIGNNICEKLADDLLIGNEHINLKDEITSLSLFSNVRSYCF